MLALFPVALAGRDAFESLVSYFPSPWPDGRCLSHWRCSPSPWPDGRRLKSRDTYAFSAFRRDIAACAAWQGARRPDERRLNPWVACALLSLLSGSLARWGGVVPRRIGRTGGV
ncbi:MAG: hypothetical protein H7839_06070 [Magnetococcus sp. YQC-5]